MLVVDRIGRFQELGLEGRCLRELEMVSEVVSLGDAPGNAPGQFSSYGFRGSAPVQAGEGQWMKEP